MRRFVWRPALGGLGLLTIALGAFATSFATTPRAETVDPPAVLHLTLPDAPERRLVEQHCVACHDLRRVENAGGSRTGWTTRLRRMIRRGATLPLQDVPTVAAYLARTLPERPRPPDPEQLQSAP